METITSPSYCGMLVKGLKYFAVGTFDPKASEHSGNKMHFVIHVVSWFIMEMCLLGGCFDAASFNERILSFTMLGNLILSMSKFVMFSLNRNSLHKFIKFIDIHAVSHTKTDVYLKKAIKDIKGSIKAYGFTAVFGGLTYMGGAVFFAKPEDNTETKYWEICHMYLPYDVVIFERIGVVRFIMTIISLYHGYCQVFLDIVSISLFTHVGWQFKATADLFEGVIYSEDHTESRIRLKEVIDYHQFLLGYAENLQKMYNGIFLAQLVGCCLPICFCLLLFVQNIKPGEGYLVDAISHLSFFIVFSYQLFLYTRCADLTEERAISVSDGIYLSDWHLASPSTRLDLMWVLMHAQRPISYSAMGIFPMAVSTFTQIMRGAYGVFSLMTGMD